MFNFFNFLRLLRKAVERLFSQSRGKKKNLNDFFTEFHQHLRRDMYNRKRSCNRFNDLNSGF